MKRIEALLRPYCTGLLCRMFPRKQQISLDALVREAKKFQRVLVVYPHNETGDMLLTTPVFRAIKTNIPRGYLGVVARPLHGAVLENNPDIDCCYVYDKKKLGVFALLKWLCRIRAQQYDCALVINSVSCSLMSMLIAYYSGARYVVSDKTLCTEFHPQLKRLCSLLVDINLVQHDTQRKLDYVRALGWNALDTRPVLRLGKKEYEPCTTFFRDHAIPDDAYVVCLHLGAGKLSNRWPVKYFVEVGKALEQGKHHATILIATGLNETQLVEECQARAHDTSFHYIPLCSLRHLAAYFQRARLCIINDTGVLHVASAVGGTTLALFGPTHGDLWNPLSPYASYLQAPTTDIASLTPESVISEAEKKLMKKYDM